MSIEQLERPQTFSRDKIIMMANTLVGSRHPYTSKQLDIFFLVLAQLGEDDTPDRLYPVWPADIRDITGRRSNCDELYDAASDLMSRPIEIIHERHNKDKYPPFSRVHLGRGFIAIRLTNEIRPMLFHLKKEFTVMQLRSVLLCTSKYAKRLYMLACQWRKVGNYTITISDLKEKLYMKEPGKSERVQRWDNFKARVLDDGINQINQFTDLEMKFDLIPKRMSKSIEAVKFWFGMRDIEQLVIDFNEPIEQQRKLNKVLNDIMDYGIDKHMAIKMAKHEEKFYQFAEEMKTAEREGRRIEKQAGYLVGMFKNHDLL